MRDNYSFRTRTLLSFWIVLLLALFLPPWYYFRTLHRGVLEDSIGRATQELNLVEWMLRREQKISTTADLQTWLGELGRKLGVRITYVAEGGKVVADSEVPASEIPNLENHAGRPEIMQTQSREIAVIVRFSGTTQKELIYTAKRVPGIAGIPAGVLRVAAPLSKVKEPLESLKLSFLLFLSVVFLATAAISYLLIRRINKPLAEMIETAEAISSKDYNRRIHSSPGQEFYPLTQAINRMAESIQNQIRTVTEQKMELEAVFDAMREGVMVLDSRGKIKSVNRTFAELTSDVDGVTGRRPLEVIANPELQKICDRAIAMPEGMEAGPFNLQIVLGTERTYDVNIVWLPDQKGGLGAVAVFHDITEIKRLEKVRQDFVANVSHELRTPLTSIKGFTETLLSDARPDPETAQSFLQVILKNTNHMVKMVEDLLQLARLEAPDNPFNMAAVNAGSALLTAWRSCAHHAEGKNLNLVNQLPEDGLLVSADFDQLVQVFRNLLENAIRYSPSDEALTVSCHSQDDNVMFSVSDEGPGISRQHQQRIFERFYRIEKHRSDHWGSTGLGLAICRHIIRNHGGSIWVRSPNPGDIKGTTFFFTLRKASPEPGSPAEIRDGTLSK
jgi:two-component system, OmpR family, phosphate regulon sensor histidine kinase PhoR